MIRLTRRYRFCSSHRLHSDVLSEQQNQDTYGKCNHPYGHGHDYVVEVTVAGPIDTRTGTVVRVQALDNLVHERIVGYLDHKNLNRDVREFEQLPPTSENVAAVILERLSKEWANRFGKDGPKLETVRLHETKRNRFELRT